MTNQLKVAKYYSEKKDENGEKKPVKSYTDLAFRVFGQVDQIVVICLMFLVQFSCCVGYLYFVSNNLDLIICN